MQNQPTTFQDALDARFFDPLRERADTLASPAHEHLSRLERGDVTATAVRLAPNEAALFEVLR